MDISVVIPIFNEEQNLRPLYSRLQKAVQDLDAGWEIIFIDDGSTDDSFSILTDLHRQDPHVKALSFSRNFGHQAALTAGLDVAGGDAVIVMDADLQHPPEMLGRLVREWRKGYEIVHTIRQTDGRAFQLKNLTSSVFYRIFRFFTKIDLAQNAADFRLMDRKVVQSLQIFRERSRFLRGMTAWVGFRSTGIPYRPEKRYAGITKYSWSRMVNLALDGLVSFSVAPLYWAIYAGFGLSLLGFLEIVYALFTRFITHRALPGWTSLIIWISLVGGLQLVLMGVSAIYIAKIYEEVKQRPLYLIRERLGITPPLPQSNGARL